MMEFYVVNQALTIVGIVDVYKSAIWTERYYESGDFEIYVPATDEMMAMLQKNRFVVRMDDLRKAMIIEAVTMTTNAEDGNYLTVTGRSLSSILARRIVWKQTTYSGQFEKVVRRIVTDAFISPEIQERTMSIMTLGAEIGKTDATNAQFSGDVVETAIQNLCRPKKIGYDVEMDLEHKKIAFKIYEGADRSYNQTENPFVIFSNDFENLLSSEYESDDLRFKNVALIAGEGEGIARRKTVVGTASGIERYEIFVDAKSQSRNSGEIDATTYAALLAQKGTEKLAELSTTEKIDSEVAPNHVFVLNRDYFLGDVVEVVNEYGMAMTPRVVEVIESEDDTGYTCIPTFATDE